MKERIFAFLVVALLFGALGFSQGIIYKNDNPKIIYNTYQYQNNTAFPQLNTLEYNQDIINDTLDNWFNNRRDF